jgi:hypothetical protein
MEIHGEFHDAQSADVKHIAFNGTRTLVDKILLCTNTMELNNGSGTHGSEEDITKA